jgi:hypothetical protein
MKTKTTKKAKLSKPYRIKFTGGGAFTIVYKGGVEKQYTAKDGQTIENVRLGAQNKFLTEQDLHFADGGICYGMNKFKFITDEPAKMPKPEKAKKSNRATNAATRRTNDIKTESGFNAALSVLNDLETQVAIIHGLGGIEKWSIEAHKQSMKDIRKLLRLFALTGEHKHLTKALTDVGRLSDRVCHLWIACNPWLLT